MLDSGDRQILQTRLKNLMEPVIYRSISANADGPRGAASRRRYQRSQRVVTVNRVMSSQLSLTDTSTSTYVAVDERAD